MNQRQISLPFVQGEKNNLNRKTTPKLAFGTSELQWLADLFEQTHAMCKPCLLSLPCGTIALRQKFRLWKSNQSGSGSTEGRTKKKKRGKINVAKMLLSLKQAAIRTEVTSQMVKSDILGFWQKKGGRESSSLCPEASDMGKRGGGEWPWWAVMRNYCHYRLGRLHATRQVRGHCELLASQTENR